MAEYRMTLAEAVWFPLAAILTLLPCRSERLGHDHTGPTDSQCAYVAARNATLDWLRSLCTVISRQDT